MSVCGQIKSCYIPPHHDTELATVLRSAQEFTTNSVLYLRLIPAPRGWVGEFLYPPHLETFNSVTIQTNPSQEWVAFIPKLSWESFASHNKPTTIISMQHLF